MDRLSNEDIISHLETFLKHLNDKYKIKKAILFGSRARGDWLYSSDIDLIIVSDDFENIPFLKRISDVSMLWDNIIELQPICYTEKEFHIKKNEIGIVNEAVKTGKELAFV